MSKITLMGECMIELLQSQNVINKQGFAGDVYNTAVYLKRLFPSIQTSLLTAIGCDGLSNKMLQCFEQEGLATEHVFKLNDKQPGIYLVQTDELGERSFLYWRESSAAREIVKSLSETVVNELSADDMFFFSGISLAVIKPEDRPLFWQRMAKLKAAGVRIAFDLNYRPKLWQNKQEAQEQFMQAFAISDVLLPGVDDFAALFSLTEVESIIEFFAKFNYQELVIKNGEDNVYCLTPNSKEVVAVTPVEHVVDTTSAGDSFNGAYLGARIAGKSIEDAVMLAAQVAGFVIQHPGAIVDKTKFSEFTNNL
jgi:2-dehydro-3-deoxygluconokinase